MIVKVVDNRKFASAEILCPSLQFQQSLSSVRKMSESGEASKAAAPTKGQWQNLGEYSLNAS